MTASMSTISLGYCSASLSSFDGEFAIIPALSKSSVAPVNASPRTVARQAIKTSAEIDDVQR